MNDSELRESFAEAMFEVYQTSGVKFYQWLKPLIERVPIIYAEMEAKYHILFADYGKEEEEAVISAFLRNYKLTGNSRLDKVYYHHLSVFFSDDDDTENIIKNLIGNLQK